MARRVESIAYLIFASLAWLFLNPILFNKPASTKNWASKAVLGERIYLDRANLSLPTHHKTLLYLVLNSIALVGFIVALASGIVYSLWGAILGISLTYLAKSWFLDRMVWLYEDMKGQSKTYQDWEY
jgi:hypothetical protein